ncbi:MAG: hypothetical protein RMN51_11915 [Verrucomicrobiota bacterium]|nr:RraA family protein [Limisphaera sp.]MDW8382796.1 hypothetical protein [Verrucomicrobiota bacterium]
MTARYVLTQEPTGGARVVSESDRWIGAWYCDRSNTPFVLLLRSGSVLVIEKHGRVEGSMGSNNIVVCKRRGCGGAVSSASARDLDEVEAQGIPMYYRRPGPDMRPGHNETESVNT